MNSLGTLFRVTSFGESHGRCVGVIVDGCPAGLPLTPADIQADVDKRRTGAGPASTTRAEEDRVEILSGTFNGFATGAPICLLVWNKDVSSEAYERIKNRPRPGHADFTAWAKYGGFNDYRGGGRFSGRITVGTVMAGAVARKLLARLHIDVLAQTIEIAGIVAQPGARAKVEASPLRCADPTAEAAMTWAIEEARSKGDSLGGIIEAVAEGVPAGLGEPFFDTVEGELARALFAIPAVKGVEFGSGFPAAHRRGSENNDAFIMRRGKVVTTTNNAGGILGGISNGMPIVARVAVKPTPSISLEQSTVDLSKMTNASMSVKGRHDICIVPRAVPVVEATMAIALCDLAMRARLIPGVAK